MKDQNNAGPSWPTMLFLSWFYSGKVPKAPGTFGSLATIPLILLIGYLQVNWVFLYGFIALLTLIAILLTEHVQKKFHLHDPQWVVIDEVIGMLITWCFVPEVTIINLLLVFCVFRFFDIIKIWPASYFDRLQHGAGTILDDVVSGLYAGIISYAVMKYL